MSQNNSPEVTDPDKSDRSQVLRTNIIMWVLVIVIPVALFFALEQFALSTLPAGEPTRCESQLTDTLRLRINVTPLLIGRISHEEQTIDYTVDGQVWQPLIDMTINLPDVTPDCDTHLGTNSTKSWAWNGKVVAITADNGVTWQQWEICDEPRPVFGCVRDEHIQSVTSDAEGILVTIFAREGRYAIRSDDAGSTWQIADGNVLNDEMLGRDTLDGE